ncbi:MAG: gamma-aminobutyraldehyde dehydrogenase [Candidatus Eremiobacteraeota bacterium]|nr:gamma-aminobutyraldehyde dehydrogenase [Candidatus Eremiobacteraeota bacterium]
MVSTKVLDYKLFIGGEWVASGSGETMKVINPATGEEIARVASATAEDVNKAVAAARAAFEDGRWSGLSPGERSMLLWKFAAALEEKAMELADLETLHSGKPVKLTRNSDIPFAIDNLRFFAGACRALEGRSTAEYVTGYTSMIRREPLGVVASIAPWNYPFLMAIWKIGPALAAGNTVVLKPASITPLTSLELAKIAHEAGIPPGVLNVITGRGEIVGSALAGHMDVDMVSLTGDTATGRRIMTAASGSLKRVHLELGGKAALIVYDDADLDAAARGAVVAGFVNTGQDCTAATRIYAHESVFQSVVDRMVELTKQVRLGDPKDEKTDMGPLSSEGHLKNVSSFVERARKAGATILVGGQQARGAGLDKGFYYEPTLVTGLPQDAELVRNEVFGPVMVLLPFKTEDEVIAKANDVIFGLASSVWTKDIYKAMNTARRLDFGTVWINDHLPLASEMPHGGFKQSGFGKDMSMYSLDEYTRIKHVMADLGGQVRKGWHFTIFGDQEA